MCESDAYHPGDKVEVCSAATQQWIGTVDHYAKPFVHLAWDWDSDQVLTVHHEWEVRKIDA